MTDGQVFLQRVRIRNYKSIAACDVTLGPLNFLVGQNGSGKSNFLDALRFTSDSVRTSLDHALRERGGIAEVRRRSSGHPNHFGISVDYRMGARGSGTYAFEVAAETAGAYAIKREHCVVRRRDQPEAHFCVERGKIVHASIPQPPAAARDRLYLVNVSGYDEFRSLFDALGQMGFYSLNPEKIRDLQTPDPGLRLERDGGNLASVYGRMAKSSPDVCKRIEEYLSRVSREVIGVEHCSVGPKETVQFRQSVRGARHPWRFLAAAMSDGTLRALAILVALFQAAGKSGEGIRLVGIEEPEIALHPAAAGVLTDALREGSQYSQVIVTSHSPDLLDEESLEDDAIRAVVSVDGETRIGPLDEVGRRALQEHLYTAGELLRINQLFPDPVLSEHDSSQLSLFPA